MNRFLPIGTVLMTDLEKQEHIMILSRMVRRQGDDTMWDYCGCVLPEGYYGEEALRFFNQGDVKRLVFLGLQNERELQYAHALTQYYHTMQSKEGVANGK